MSQEFLHGEALVKYTSQQAFDSLCKLLKRTPVTYFKHGSKANWAAVTPEECVEIEAAKIKRIYRDKWDSSMRKHKPNKEVVVVEKVEGEYSGNQFLYDLAKYTEEEEVRLEVTYNEEENRLEVSGQGKSWGCTIMMFPIGGQSVVAINGVLMVPYREVLKDHIVSQFEQHG